MKTFIAIFASLLIAVAVTAAEKTQAPESPAAQLQKRAAAEANLPLEKTIDLDNDVNMVFVYIPAGEFEMGSPATELKRDSYEDQHHVKLTKAFYMGKFEVTQLQYRAVLGVGKMMDFAGFDFPADSVSWYQASTFLNKLSEKTDMLFRLPTEAEWEYACRAGTVTPFYTGETINPDQANYNAAKLYGKGLKGDAKKRTTKVGSYPPNSFGLYDMPGNVWEWCSDRYSKKSYKIDSSVDPLGTGDSLSVVIRGGGWDSPPVDCRSASRDSRKSWRHLNDIGFRVVLEIDKKVKNNRDGG